MMSCLEFEDDVTQFLVDAALAKDCDVNSLLRKLLNIRSILDDTRFSSYIEGKPHTTVKLADTLDRKLRVLNPGLHHVFRKQFIGYRRVGTAAIGPHAERSQIFVSVRVLRKALVLVLPIDPTQYQDHDEIKDVSGMGHHGVGELQYRITSGETMEKFLTLFDEWLRQDSDQYAG